MAADRRFQLVYAIRSVERGRALQATTVWAGAGGLRFICFALEAVAQAAGWLITASTGFARRGLPLSIGAVRLLEEPGPGETVDLSAEITAWRDTSAVVRGRASCGGRLLGEAEAALCALVPADELDDPLAARAGYEALLAAEPGETRIAGVAEPPGAPSIEALNAREGRATWLVTGGSGLFADHFPRFPVLPGSLQVQALVDLAQAVAAAGGPAGRADRVRQVRFRRPVRPGERLTLEAALVARRPDRTIVRGRALLDGQRAASIEEIHITPAA